MEVGEGFKIYTTNKKDVKKICSYFEDFFIQCMYEDDEERSEEELSNYKNLFKFSKEDDLCLGEIQTNDYLIFQGEALPDSNVEAYFAFLIDFISKNPKLYFETKHIFSYRGNGSKEVYYYKYTGDALIYKSMGGDNASFYDDEEIKNAEEVIDGIVNPNIYSEKQYDVKNGVVMLDTSDKPHSNVCFSW